MSTDHLEPTDDARLIANAIDRLTAYFVGQPPVRLENQEEAALRIQGVLIENMVDPHPFATAIELAEAIAMRLVR